MNHNHDRADPMPLGKRRMSTHLLIAPDEMVSRSFFKFMVSLFAEGGINQSLAGDSCRNEGTVWRALSPFGAGCEASRQVLAAIDRLMPDRDPLSQFHADHPRCVGDLG
jgi:hypothetical protein